MEIFQLCYQAYFNFNDIVTILTYMFIIQYCDIMSSMFYPLPFQPQTRQNLEF